MLANLVNAAKTLLNDQIPLKGIDKEVPALNTL